MYTKFCVVCKKNVGFCGWAKHVAKEKRLYGDGIYNFMKIDRIENRDNGNFKAKIIDLANHKLSEWGV